VWWHSGGLLVAAFILVQAIGSHDGGAGLQACSPDQNGAWIPMTQVDEPTPRGSRTGHSALWTGERLLIWGGEYVGAGGFTTRYGDGGQYDPGSDSWLPISTTGGPRARAHHTAVWTGRSMLVWGGAGAGAPRAGYYVVPPEPLGDGFRYDPGADVWTPISKVGAPTPRFRHTAVWTGEEMLVWGGHADQFGTRLADGARYDPVADSWSPISPAPEGVGSDALWTGEMLIVGLRAQWDPRTDQWREISRFEAPAGTRVHGAVWTDSRVLVWGQDVEPPYAVRHLGSYDPTVDQWQPGSLAGALEARMTPPRARQFQTSVWTGRELILWGGSTPFAFTYGTVFYRDGAAYDPGTERWRMLPEAPVGPRAEARAVWTGAEVLIWGGTSFQGGPGSGGMSIPLQGGARYNPPC
jgi:N-acetylneuraminic acid mutarotase